MVSIDDSSGLRGSISSARTDADYPRETTLYSLAGDCSTGTKYSKIWERVSVWRVCCCLSSNAASKAHFVKIRV